MRSRADEHEERGTGDLGLLAAALDDDGLEPHLSCRPGAPLHLADRGVAPDLDVRRAGDLIDQVGRHGTAEVGPADDHRDLLRVAREEHGPLARRVGAADDEHILAPVERGLGQRGAVVDAGSRQRLRARHLEPPDGDARGRDERHAGELGPVGERHDLVVGVDADARDLLGNEDLCAEPLRLRRRPPREIGAAQPLRKAEVVLDPRARAGLAARRVLLDEDCAEALRCAVHRGRETGRPRADDREIVERELGRRAHAELGGERAAVRAAELLPVREDHDRQLVDGLEERLVRGVPLEIDPSVGNAVAGEEVLHLVRGPGPERAGDAEPFVGHRRLGLPLLEQIVEHREEVILGRIPRLHQVVVEADFVDARDGGLRVGVGREQDLLRVGEDLDRRAEELRAAHAGHALVDEQDGERPFAGLQLAHGRQRLLSAARLHHAHAVLEVPAQIALDRVEHLRLVVDGEEDRLLHGTSSC